MTDSRLGTIEFQYPVFPDSTIPVGHLPRDKAAQACWYYYILAEKARTNVGKGPESQIIVVETGRDGDVHWMDKHYSQQLLSLAQIYQVNPQDILNYWPSVIREATRMGLPAPHSEYMNPKRWLTQ